MPEFKLTARVVVSASTTIEADTLEEAIRKAERRMVALEGHGSDEGQAWIISDADGEPDEICEADDDGPSCRP